MNFHFSGKDEDTGDIRFEKHGKISIYLDFHCKSLDISEIWIDDNGKVIAKETAIKNTDIGMAKLWKILNEAESKERKHYYAENNYLREQVRNLKEQLQCKAGFWWKFRPWK